MELKDSVFKRLVKNGYASSNGTKSWDISERKHLFLNPEQSKGFLALRKFDKYKKNVVDREVDLIKTKKDQLCKFVGEGPFNVIDVCCGDGTKVIELLKTLPCDNGQVRYVPVNVSDHLVDLALKNLRKERFNVISEFKPIVGDWDGRDVAKLAAQVRDKTYKKNVVLLLGSVLASFDINDYLFELSRGLRKGDYVVIGNGIRLGERLVHLDSYKHDAFNNWFIHLVKGLGISRRDVEYDARFGNSRVEMFYRMKNNKTIEHEGKKIDLRKGDEILVSYLYKYYEKELKKFCKMYFENVELVKDEDNEYALVICKK